MRFAKYSTLACGMVLASFLAIGCGPKMEAPKKTLDTSDGKKIAAADHDHSGWWCDAHGVPEEVCSICSSKAAAQFKKDKDWCDKHDRADSQCFECHPERFAKFAAQYEAKYNKQPPKPTE